jgi:hypothetical protein
MTMPPLGARFEVDAVVADAEVRDEPQRRQQLERDGLIRDDQRFDVFAPLAELVQRQDVDVQLAERGAGVAARSENLHEVWSSRPTTRSKNARFSAASIPAAFSRSYSALSTPSARISSHARR